MRRVLPDRPPARTRGGPRRTRGGPCGLRGRTRSTGRLARLVRSGPSTVHADVRPRRTSGPRPQRIAETAL